MLTASLSGEAAMIRTSLNSVACALFALMVVVLSPAAAAGPPQGEGTYEEFLTLWTEFQAARTPEPWNTNFNDPGAENHGLADYSPSATRGRLRALAAFRKRLINMNVAAWTRERQSEWLAVRAAFDAEEFLLRVSRPWARDPGFFVDQLQRFAFQDLPVSGEALEQFERELAAIPAIVSAARATLDDVAADYAMLALRNLTAADGVGHGNPWRATPPAGVIGWYEDLRARAATVQPSLMPAIDAALASARGLRDWIAANEARFDGMAGVGSERFDWYMKYAKLLPYDGAALELLGEREWRRLTAFYAIARHRNRALPELQPAASAAEYAKRLAATDKSIREFLKREEIITVPADVGALGNNVPFIERPGGLNFWEAIQFRDPHPDHLHAVIPGHRFDQVMEDRNAHPVRGKISDGARVEGWAVYLEESMLQAGVLENRPRVDELIYLFGIFRATRVPADVRMQRNEISVSEAVKYMRDGTPWLDENVARVDAEIYLRRPPGYGVGYTVGAIQMQALLADRRAQLGDKLNMKSFHDDFMSRGRLPMALLRWEMTGLDNEVRHFWDWKPIPGK